MRGLPFFKPKKGAQFAGLGFSDGSGGGGSYVLPTASADTLGGVKVGNNLSIDANGVLSATGGVDPSMIAGTESTTTSTHSYAIGEYFISSTGLLCKATSAIAIDDTISIGTSAGDNAISVTVGGELTELNSKFIPKKVIDIDSSLKTLTDIARYLIGIYGDPFIVFFEAYSMTDSSPDGLYIVTYNLRISGGVRFYNFNTSTFININPNQN